MTCLRTSQFRVICGTQLPQVFLVPRDLVRQILCVFSCEHFEVFLVPRRSDALFLIYFSTHFVSEYIPFDDFAAWQRCRKALYPDSCFR